MRIIKSELCIKLVLIKSANSIYIRSLNFYSLNQSCICTTAKPYKLGTKIWEGKWNTTTRYIEQILHIAGLGGTHAMMLDGG
jgi:hypothetical protein